VIGMLMGCASSGGQTNALGQQAIENAAGDGASAGTVP